ncbi:MAG TPA: NUDIX domain-containing protein [Pilimelia sp.]|nr:NUDIX domain-containing protein [Pilimelia sp.]
MPDPSPPRRSGLRHALRGLVYGVFYRLPVPLRRAVVRRLVRTYVVGAVVVLRDAADPDRILLLRQPPGRGWTLPAGLLRKAEAPADGAVRELAEETGIRLTPAQLQPATPNALVHARGWIDLVYTAQVPAAHVTPVVDGAEVWEAAWHHRAALPPLTPATARLLGHYGIGPQASDRDGEQPA